MEVIYERCCGIDVHKKMLAVCLFNGRQKEIRNYGTMTEDVLEMVKWLKEADCQAVAMESTGVYWKPIYNLLEEEGMRLIVANAQHIKSVPGRKTDVKDAEWIADLARHGLIRASFIPKREQRELREITRYRQDLIEERAREFNRIQAVLEGANIKLASVITDISGATGKRILRAIVDGIEDPEQLSELSLGCARKKIAELQRALKGSVKDHQRMMLRHQLNHVEMLDNEIKQLDLEIKKNRICSRTNRIA